MGHRARDELLVRNGPDGLVEGRVEDLAGVIAPRKAQVSKHRECLLVHRAYALDDLVRIG